MADPLTVPAVLFGGSGRGGHAARAWGRRDNIQETSTNPRQIIRERPSVHMFQLLIMIAMTVNRFADFCGFVSLLYPKVCFQLHFMHYNFAVFIKHLRVSPAM
jgi:hypothetical protein